jgi:hypothetical protein
LYFLSPLHAWQAFPLETVGTNNRWELEGLMGLLGLMAYGLWLMAYGQKCKHEYTSQFNAAARAMHPSVLTFELPPKFYQGSLENVEMTAKYSKLSMSNIETADTGT